MDTTTGNKVCGRMCCCIRDFRGLGLIIDILLIKLDELETEEFSSHFHSFVVQRPKPIPIAFCKPDELSDHHTLGLYILQLFHDTYTTYYIVPQYNLM